MFCWSRVLLVGAGMRNKLNECMHDTGVVLSVRLVCVCGAKILASWFVGGAAPFIGLELYFPHTVTSRCIVAVHGLFFAVVVEWKL